MARVRDGVNLTPSFALMPMLAVVGYGVATMNMHIATGSFLLFMTNLLAIALSVALLARWYRFTASDGPANLMWQTALTLVTFTALPIPPGQGPQPAPVPLASKQGLPSNLTVPILGGTSSVPVRQSGIEHVVHGAVGHDHDEDHRARGRGGGHDGSVHDAFRHIESETPVTTQNDQQAIARLEETFALQRSAYRRAPCPPLAERLELLQRIPGMMMSNARRIADALNSDYGYHSELTAYMFDVVNVVGRAQYVAKVLPTWMARDYRELEPSLYGSSRSYIEYQPKGVVGNMPAWNFPVDLSVGPLCEMLAAGNRVIIKPSEQTPAVGQLLAEMIGATFDRDRVSVENGGVDLARHFSTLKWDHLLYTGNTAIGREVLRKAAENLVPVTLELGGKNPTVFTEEGVTAKNVAQMLGAKLTKNGQLCITVDHCLVPAGTLDRFVALVKEFVAAKLGDYTTSDLNCAVINARQFDRLQRYVDEAKANDSSKVIELGSTAQRNGGPCRMPLTLVINPAPGSLLDGNEVFGPILPIITYTEFDQAIAHVQAGERPLGIYVFSEQPELVERLRNNTSSGGFCVNAASLQGAQENLGFGGVGKSGMGRHHGIEGFREFSNPRGCVELASDANLEPLMSPHGEVTRQFLKAVTGGLLGG